MFSGSLSQMDLSEVLKLLSASHQTGVLNLMDTSDGSIIAMVYMQVGQLVHTQYGGASGLDAMSQVCKLSDAAFAFEENVVAPQQSLAAYPTDKLMAKMEAQIAEAKALRVAMPESSDIPVYQQGVSLAGLDATADDLSLLILCNGTRTVEDLARDSRRTLLDAAKAIAKFRKAGIIEVKKGGAAPPSASVPSTPAAAPAQHHDGTHEVGPGSHHLTPIGEVDASGRRVVRYWRGKPVYE